jgi:hypothetical protein
MRTRMLNYLVRTGKQDFGVALVLAPQRCLLLTELYSPAHFSFHSGWLIFAGRSSVSPSELAGRAKSSEFSLPDDSLTLASTLPRNRQLAVGTQLRGRVNFVCADPMLNFISCNRQAKFRLITNACTATTLRGAGTSPSRAIQLR